MATAHAEVNHVHIRRDQELTVHIDLGDKDELYHDDNTMQIKIRVTPNGELQVFTDGKFYVKPLVESEA